MSPEKPHRAPPLSLIKWLLGLPFTQAIYVAAKIGVADLLKDGPKNCLQLAEAAHVDADALQRLLRMLVNTGLLSRAVDGSFTLTSAGRFLQSDEPNSLYDLAKLGGEAWHLQPWTELLYSVTTGQPAFDRLHGVGFYDFLSQHPACALLFDRAMDSVVGRFARLVAVGCDLQGAAVVVDIGGGRGTLLGEILGRNRDLKGILFDKCAESVGVHEYLEAMGVAERCTRITGDFFKSVPAGGDIYLLSHVLHNWHDDRAVAILRNCRNAMGPAARLLVVEVVIAGEPDFYSSWLDLEMLVNFGGRERTEPEYRRLLGQADLRVARLIATESPVSVIECVSA